MPGDPRTDDQLIDQINRDWPHIDLPFTVLYHRHKHFVLRIAERFTTDPDAAQDVVQQVFIALLGKFPGFVLSAKLSTFLYPLAKRAALKSAGRARRSAQGLAILAAAQQRAGHGEAEAEGAHARAAGYQLAPLQAAVEALPEAQREVLVLRVVEGMSVEDVAAALGIPPGTVKSRMHHAVAALRGDARLARYFEP